MRYFGANSQKLIEIVEYLSTQEMVHKSLIRNRPWAKFKILKVLYIIQLILIALTEE